MIGAGIVGVTTACGSACVLADLGIGRRAAVDISRLGLAQLRLASFGPA